MSNKLQYISQGSTSKNQLDNIKAALDAGCNWLQLRSKNVEPNELQTLAGQVKMACDKYGATFIVNDHPIIAKAVDADGAHLGLTDMDIKKARQIVGPNKIIGGTANTLQHVLQRVDEGCGYVGLGPFRFTETKQKLSPILGLEGYKMIMNELKKRDVVIPIYAIGGIGLDDITGILEMGVHGVAISGVITHHPDKKSLIEQLNTMLKWNN